MAYTWFANYATQPCLISCIPGFPISTISTWTDIINQFFPDAIVCLRRELWRERIKRMFGVWAVHDKKFEFLLEALAPVA
jgi:hypothetical protein